MLRTPVATPVQFQFTFTGVSFFFLFYCIDVRYRDFNSRTISTSSKYVN